MKKIWKRSLAMLLVVIMFGGTMPIGALTNVFSLSASAVSSGKCGDNACWSLSDDGVLSITGSGKIYDYSSSSTPWYPNYYSIHSLNIQNGITSIGKYAFRYLQISEVAIPNSVTEIGDYAFSGTKLKKIVLPDSVKKTGANPFHYCESAASAQIGSGLTEIGYGGLGLSTCTNLTSIVVDKSNTYFHSQNNCFIETQSKTVIDGCKASVIPNDGSVNHIGRSAFYGCNGLLNIRIPKYIKTIDNYAFESCSQLKDVYLEEGLEEIGGMAFYGCSKLENVFVWKGIGEIVSGDGQLGGLTLPESLTKLGMYVFTGCDALKSIFIPKGVTEIGWRNSFSGGVWGNPQLESITVDSRNTVYHSEGNCLIATRSKHLITGCKTSIIPDDGSVTSIGDAFKGCSGLKEIFIPQTINRIDMDAFLFCPNLKDIYYEGSEEQWKEISIDKRQESDSFYDDDALISARIHYHSVIDIPIEEPTDVTNQKIEFTLPGVFGDEKGVTTVNFKNEWFNHSIEYNHALAQFCADYSMMGYAYSSDIVQYLKASGFSVMDYDMEATRDHVNFFIAKKKILVKDKENILLFVGTIGSYTKQWYSDFDPLGYHNEAKDKSLAEGVNHRGFADARDFVYSRLSKCVDKLKKNGTDIDSIQILLTGHSRGAAAANLLAVKLLDEAYDNKSDRLVNKGNIYAYTFATPNVTNDKNRNSYKYDRIFNIVNPEDFVTRVLLKSWGFSKYGRTYTLPSYTNTKEKKYRSQLKAMQELFSQYKKGSNYMPFYHTRGIFGFYDGEKPVYDIITQMGNSVKDLTQFYEKKDVYGQGSSYDYFRNTLCPLLAEKSWKKIPAVLPTIMSRVFPFTLKQKITSFFIHHLFEFADSHCMQTYAAYVKSLSERDLIATKSSKYNGVACPVDIEVYDNETGRLVGKITNNVVDETVQSSEGAVVMDVDGDLKSFWLPSDGDYRIVLTGNDNGTMDYTVSEIDSDAGETKRINFYDVKIKDGVSMTGVLSDELTDLTAYRLKTANGAELAPTEIIEGESKEYQINVTLEGYGYASESQTVTGGDYVTLSAEVPEGSEFFGWYENGALVTADTEFSFVAKANRNMTAKFKEAQIVSVHVSKMPAKTVYTYKKDANIDLSGMELEATYADGSKRTITDLSACTVSGYSAKPKGDKTVSVEFEGVKTELHVTVKYAWWQYLILIFLLGFIWY